MATLSKEARRAYQEDAVLPDGWQWCPDCEGEGVLITNDISTDPPRLVGRACQRCKVEYGIVPA